MSGQNKLAICEIFNPEIHGISELSSKNISTHFLVHTTVKPSEFYNNSYNDTIKTITKGYYYYRWAEGPMHPIIRNYEHLIKRNPNLEIVIIKELEGMEQVAILKTFWLRIFQRCCIKKIRRRRSVFNRWFKGFMSIQHIEMNC